LNKGGKYIQVHCEPALRKFEDMALALQIMEAGGQTFKILRYAYRANHIKAGGCETSRGLSCSDGLMSNLAFNQLTDRRKAVINLLIRGIQSKED
jgi:hypothetical protein